MPDEFLGHLAESGREVGVCLQHAVQVGFALGDGFPYFVEYRAVIRFVGVLAGEWTGIEGSFRCMVHFEAQAAVRAHKSRCVMLQADEIGFFWGEPHFKA